ncbi:MAG: TraR/DksA family transcriptional regulator [Actinobacteria bacterium]|nr:TraR/DksA family transcriptional regulator [Actinomycetota bacterium]
MGRTDAVRTRLEERRRDLTGELDELTAAPRDPMTAVSFGKRVGDGTTQAVERLNQVGTADVLAAMLVDVERALAKLDEGTYGVCDVCGAEIPAERLEARPWSVLCVGCSAAR